MFFCVNMSINLAEQTLVLSLQRVKNSTPLKQDRTRLHSSRVRTARSLPYGGFRDRDPPTWTEAPPTPGQRPPLDRDLPVDRQKPVKILPCPKLRLRVVKMERHD